MKKEKETKPGYVPEEDDEAEREPAIISVKCPYNIKEHVDCRNDSGQWRNGEIINMRRNEVRIHFSGTKRDHDKWIDYRSPMIQKQWKENMPFRINNRIDAKDESGNWYEAIITAVHPNYIDAADLYNLEEKCTIHVESSRIAPVGKFSNAFGHAKQHQLEDYYHRYNQEDKKGSKTNGHAIPSMDAYEKREHVKVKEDRKASLYENLREREAQFICKMTAKGLKIKEVLGDGNCLFRSIADQLYGNEEYHEQIRKWCMDYISIEKEFFSDYIIGGAEAFDSYVEAKRRSGVWGDDIEIEALSEIYGIPIEIYAYNDTPMRTFHENSSALERPRPVCLSYHGRCHYNSIVPLNSSQIPILNKPVGEIEIAFVNRARLRPGKKEEARRPEEKEEPRRMGGIKPPSVKEEIKKPEEKEEEKVLGLSKNISQARATFAEHGCRDMESAFLEFVCSRIENESIAEVKKISEAAQIDKDITQAAIQSSLKDIEEQEKAKLNEAILASIVSQLSNIPPTVRSIMAQGFSYEDSMEAFRIVGDDADRMMNYLLDK